MKIVRLGLLSGASLLALVIGTGTPAKAAACTAASGGTSDYSNDATCDYILITGDYTNGADVINNGVVGGGPLFAGTTVDSLFGLHARPFRHRQHQHDGHHRGCPHQQRHRKRHQHGRYQHDRYRDRHRKCRCGNRRGIINNGNIFVEANDPGTGNDFAAAIGIAATGVTDTIFQNATGAVLDVFARRL